MATERSDSSHSPPDEDHKARISNIRSLPLEDLKEKLFSCIQTKSDDPLFTLRDASNSSAKCWSQFQHVYEKKKGIVFVAQEWGFVACTKCGKVYSYRSAHGTSTLTKHTKKDCAKSSLAKTRSITEYLGTQKVSGSDKKRIIEAVARMCCTDMRPFNNIVSGVGFKEFTRVVFEIGFRSQRLCDATDLLPVPNTVRNNVQDDADLIRTKLVQICLERFGGCCGAGFTADLWTDSIRKRTYLSLTFHYLTVAFELHARTLQVKEIEGISHTAPVLLGVFSESLADFGIVDTSKCTAVTDCGSNLCGSQGLPSKYKWIPCADHKIAILITTVLSKTTATESGTVSAPFYKYYDEAPEIYELLDRCKALVGYVKKSKLQKQLEFTLKKENVTRWNSQLVMFESILKSYDQVTELLAQRGKSVYISCIDKELLEELMRFLLPFREATCTLEKWKDPTLHLVVHERHKLMTLLQPQLDRVMIDKKKKTVLDGPLDIRNVGDIVVIPPDSKNLLVIKKLMRENSAPKWQLDVYHIVAVVLDPRQKKRLDKFGVTAEELKNAKDKLVDLKKIESFDRAEFIRPRGKKTSNKKLKSASGAIIIGAAALCSSDERDSDDDAPRSYDDELDELNRFLNSELSESDKTGFDLLKWWGKTGAVHYPRLGKVARSLLYIPAASAMSESNFSNAGMVMTKARSSLKPSVLDDILVVRSNGDLAKR